MYLPPRGLTHPQRRQLCERKESTMPDEQWKRSGTWIYIETTDPVVHQTLVAKMSYLGGIGEQEQMADRIVRACNAHDDLLAACKAAEWGATDDWDDPLCPVCHRTVGEGHADDCILAAAIAKAEGTDGR